MKKGIALCVLFLLSALCVGCGKQSEDDVTVLRVANWEEYIDEGGWSEDETIELADGTKILGKEEMTELFEQWYEKKYGEKSKWNIPRLAQMKICTISLLWEILLI